MDTANIRELLERLSEEDRISAYHFICYFAECDKRRKAQSGEEQ